MIRRTFMGISLMSILNIGNTTEVGKENKARKALIIYFSRNGMNYWHGDTKNPCRRQYCPHGKGHSGSDRS